MAPKNDVSPAQALTLAHVAKLHREKDGASAANLLPFFEGPDDASASLYFLRKSGFVSLKKDDDRVVYRITRKGEESRGRLPKALKPEAVARRLSRGGAYALALLAGRRGPDFEAFALMPRDAAREKQIVAELSRERCVDVSPDDARSMRVNDFGAEVAILLGKVDPPAPRGRPRLSRDDERARREAHAAKMREVRRANKQAREAVKLEKVVPIVKPLVVEFGARIVRSAVTHVDRELRK